MADRGGDFARGGRALHPDRIDLHVQSVVAAAEDVEDVADRCAGGAGHHGDALRQHWNRLFPRRLEQSFLGEPLFELLECELQRAKSRRLRGSGIEREVALRVIDRETSAHDEIQSVLDAEAKEARVAREQHDAHLRARVFDREIAVSGRRACEIRDFALDGDVVVTKEIDVDLPEEIADGPDVHERRVTVEASSLLFRIAQPVIEPASTEQEPHMNVRTLIKRTATATGFAAMVVFTSACAHHNSSTTADNDFGHDGQEGPTTQVSSTSPTPIPGPAKVDDTGRVYTSSAAGGTGNADNVGTNTNVNVIPGKVKSTTDVTYTE